MTNWFNYVFNRISISLGSGGVLVACVVATFLQCLVCFILSLFKREYCLKKRTWCVFTVCATLIFSIALLVGIPASPTYSLCAGAFAVLFLSLVFCVGERSQKCSEEQRELARFIDRQITRPLNSDEKIGDDIESEKNCVSIKSDLEREKEEKNEIKNYEIDFEHVKNVIRRMDYFGLSVSDKKQVRELEIALSEAERGEFTKEVKGRINDGLSALLKIMSKYGV